MMTPPPPFFIDQINESRRNWKRHRKYTLTGILAVTAAVVAEAAVNEHTGLLKSMGPVLILGLMLLLQSWSGLITNKTIDALLLSCAEHGADAEAVLIQLGISVPPSRAAAQQGGQPDAAARRQLP